jgi:hypothetical protein
MAILAQDLVDELTTVVPIYPFPLKGSSPPLFPSKLRSYVLETF